jgi:3-phenylpropionate/trans-cinnamate dioxygenase ferredoxin component
MSIRTRIERKGGVTMSEFVTVTGAAEVAEGALAAFDVGGARVAIANVGGTLHAFGDTCTHLQCSLAQGDLDGTVVTCPCHGSRFDVTTGALLRGPAQVPVPSYAARVEDDVLRVEI